MMIRRRVSLPVSQSRWAAAPLALGSHGGHRVVAAGPRRPPAPQLPVCTVTSVHCQLPPGPVSDPAGRSQCGRAHRDRPRRRDSVAAAESAVRRSDGHRDVSPGARLSDSDCQCGHRDGDS
jgi:hypothetical protein